MRVGLVIYGSLRTTTGGYLYDRKLVEHLRNRDLSVDIIELSNGTYPRHLIDNVLPSVRHKLRTTDVDVLLQDELCHPSVYWVNKHLDPATPIVSIVHHLRSSESHPPIMSHLSRWVETRYLRTLDGVITNSRTTKTAVDRLVSIDQTVIAPPGTGRFTPSLSSEDIELRAHEPGPLRIVFLGSLIPRKGLHTLIRGLSSLPHGEWALTVIGDTQTNRGYYTRIKHECDQLDIHDSIRFTGRLSKQALADELMNSHLMAIPSAYEGFGIAYLEGMGFGLPALATTAGGASELITDNTNGFLVPSNDPLAITHRLKPLLDDRTKLTELGQAARTRYDKHPTWTETMETVHSFLMQFTNA